MFFNIAKKILIKRSKIEQIKSPLRDLSLWGLTVNDDGHIEIAGHDSTDLVEKYGSPLLVVDRKRLHQDINSIQGALQIAPEGSQVLYSYKTNCIPGILAEIHKQGVGAEVISPYELWLAYKLGVPGDETVFNGVNKTDESLKMAIEMNVLSINVDYLDEVERIYAVAKRMGRKARVGIRLGLVKKSQFGLQLDDGEALEAARLIHERNDWLELNGLHFNVTSNTKSSESHCQAAEKAVGFLNELYQRFVVQVMYLDIGGGFGVPTTKNMSGREYGLYRLTGALPCPPAPDDFQPIDQTIKDILRTIQRCCDEKSLSVPKILIEPGRFVTSRAEVLLNRVNTIKKRVDGTQFALTDAGRLSMTFPLDFEYHEIFLANRPQDPLEEDYYVMGRICTSADWLVKNRYLPILKQGDILMVMDAGAYFSSYSSNFAFPRPAIVMVDEKGDELIREAESFEHMTAMDRVKFSR